MCNCNTNCGCNTTTIPCECKVKLNSDCIDNITEDLTCSNILKGQTLSEVLVQLDAYICDRFTSVEEFIKLINVGAGSQIYKGDTLLGKKQLRTLVDSGLINIAQGTDTITISVDEVAMNTFIESNQKTYSASNIGTGAQVYKNTTIVGDNTQINLRKIKSSNSSVSIIEDADDIDVTVAIEGVNYESIVIPLSDIVSNLTTGNSKAYFRVPFSATVDSVRASVFEAQVSGSVLTFDINQNGTSILSTKITIDNTEKTSLTASIQPVVSNTSLTQDSEITFDIDQIGTVGAKGAIVTLIVTRL